MGLPINELPLEDMRGTDLFYTVIRDGSGEYSESFYVRLSNLSLFIGAGGGGGGDVVGPAASTDNAIARFNLATGKLLQDSSVLIADDGSITGVEDMTIDTPVNIYLLSHDSFADYVADQHIDWKSTAENLLTSGTITTDDLYLYDTNASHTLLLHWNEDEAGANRTLNLVMGGADRTITFSGNPTLADWFDQAVKAASNVLFGTIGCGTITIADGSSLNLQEDITFLGATTENIIKFPDNLADALSLAEAGNKYITLDTTNDAEQIEYFSNQYVVTKLGTDEAVNAAIDTTTLNILLTAGGAIDAVINVDRDYTTIRGSGAGVNLDASSWSQDDHVIDLNSFDYATVRDLRMTGQDGVGGAFDLIYGSGCTHPRILNNWLIDSTDEGLYLSGGTYGKVVGNYVDNSDGDGMIVGGFSSGTVALNTTRLNGSYGINLTSGRGCVILGNSSLQDIVISYTLVADTVRFVANSVVGGHGTGVWFQLDYSTCVGNTFWNAGVAIKSYGSHSTYTGNAIYDSSGAGLEINSGEVNSAVAGNVFHQTNNTHDDIELVGGNNYFACAGNIFSSAGGQSERAINVVNSDYGAVVGCTSYGHDTGSIVLDSDCNHWVIIGNQLESAPVDNGANNIIFHHDTTAMITYINHAIDCGAITSTGNLDVTGTGEFTGNVGVGGSTILDWDSTFNVIQVNSQGAFYTQETQRIGLGQNTYYDDTNNRWDFITNDEASTLELSGGNISLNVSNGAGAVGTAVTFVTALSLAKTTGNATFAGKMGILVAPSTQALKIVAADGVCDNTAVVYMENAEATAGRNYGLQVKAGSNASDWVLLLEDKAGTDLVNVYGDGTAYFRNHVGIGVAPAASFRLNVQSSIAAGYAALFHNDGNNVNRYGIRVQGGEDTESGTNYYVRCMDGNGTETGGLRSIAGAFAVYNTSDVRLKDKIVDTEYSGRDKIIGLRVRDFERTRNPGKQLTGFIANEVEGVIPEAVASGENEVKCLSVTAFIPYLVKHNQEQEVKIEALEAVDLVFGSALDTATNERQQIRDDIKKLEDRLKILEAN